MKMSATSTSSGNLWVEDKSNSLDPDSSHTDTLTGALQVPENQETIAPTVPESKTVPVYRPTPLTELAGVSNVPANPSSLWSHSPVASRSLFDLVTSTQTSFYQPLEFFVAWQGVLTIAYSGIPPALVKLKNCIDEYFPYLVPENPGTKWPKTTLACLRDNQRLSLSQLATLRQICSQESIQLGTSAAVRVDQLSIVLYETCCLEKLLCKTDIPLRGPLDEASPAADQLANTNAVLNEFASKNLGNYWFHASKDGYRSQHYRKSKLGATLVHFLGGSLPPALAQFRQRVEESLPGMYDWFSTESLHITLRALS